VYDGKTITIHSPDDNVYATAPATDSLGTLIGDLLDAGVELPLIDVLYQATAGTLMENVRTGQVVGDAEVEGVACDSSPSARPMPTGSCGWRRGARPAAQDRDHHAARGRRSAVLHGADLEHAAEIRQGQLQLRAAEGCATHPLRAARCLCRGRQVMAAMNGFDSKLLASPFVAGLLVSTCVFAMCVDDASSAGRGGGAGASRGGGGGCASRGGGVVARTHGTTAAHGAKLGVRWQSRR
jgi:hypothetical protein